MYTESKSHFKRSHHFKVFLSWSNKAKSRYSPTDWIFTPLHAEKECRMIHFSGWQEVGRAECADFPVPLVEVERLAVEVGEHVILKHLLVAVQWELLAAHRADLPVALHVLLELALVVVGREDDLAERTPLHVHAAQGEKGKEGSRGVNTQSRVMMWANREPGLINGICVMRRGWPAAPCQQKGSVQQNTLDTCNNAQVWKL